MKRKPQTRTRKKPTSPWRKIVDVAIVGRFVMLAVDAFRGYFHL